MAKESFERQIELAESLKSSLNRLQESLGAASKSYQQRSNELRDAGMMAEFSQKFIEEYVAETTQRINNVVEQINGRDIPFIQNYIVYLEQGRAI